MYLFYIVRCGIVSSFPRATELAEYFAAYDAMDMSVCHDSSYEFAGLTSWQSILAKCNVSGVGSARNRPLATIRLSKESFTSFGRRLPLPRISQLLPVLFTTPGG